MLRIELVKSPTGNTRRNRATIVALGLRKVHQVVDQPDNPSIRGMIHHVKHMLLVTEVEGEPEKTAKVKKTADAKPKPKIAAAPKKKVVESTAKAEKAPAESKAEPVAKPAPKAEATKPHATKASAEKAKPAAKKAAPAKKKEK